MGQLKHGVLAASKAGVSVFERIFLWSPTAAGGEPYDPAAGGEAKADFHEDILAVIAALPLNRRSLLVDIYFGPGTPLLWKLRDRLLGALVLNVHLFMAEGFAQTEMFGEIQKRMRFLSDVYRQRDFAQILSFLPDIMQVRGPRAWLEQASEKKYRKALLGAFSKFWHLACVQLMWNFNRLSNVLRAQEPWREGPPVILLCSNRAPAMVLMGPMHRLSELLPGSRMEFLGRSKWSWHLEGRHVHQQVLGYLSQLVQFCASSLVHQPIKENDVITTIYAQAHPFLLTSWRRT